MKAILDAGTQELATAAYKAGVAGKPFYVIDGMYGRMVSPLPGTGRHVKVTVERGEVTFEDRVPVLGQWRTRGTKTVPAALRGQELRNAIWNFQK